MRLDRIKYTTQNLLRITFTMSCQHFSPKQMFKFLVNQCWKLIQRCSLKVSLAFLSPLFQHIHQSTLKICHSRKRVASMCMSILTLVQESVLHIIVSLIVNLCISGLQSSFGEISENCNFWSKMRFLNRKFDFFSGSNCSSFTLQLNAENRINIRAVYNEIHVFKLFLYGIYMVAIRSKILNSIFQ